MCSQHHSHATSNSKMRMPSGNVKCPSQHYNAQPLPVALPSFKLLPILGLLLVCLIAQNLMSIFQPPSGQGQEFLFGSILVGTVILLLAAVVARMLVAHTASSDVCAWLQKCSTGMQNVSNVLIHLLKADFRQMHTNIWQHRCNSMEDMEATKSADKDMEPHFRLSDEHPNSSLQL